MAKSHDDVVPGCYIATKKWDGVPFKATESQVASEGSLQGDGTYLVSVCDKNANSQATEKDLKAQGFTTEPEGVMHIFGEPNDIDKSGQWGLNDDANGARVKQAWDYAQGDYSIVIATPDTGVNYDHEDLYRNIWINEGEIPASIKSKLTDVDNDGIISFYDLNDPKNYDPNDPEKSKYVKDLNGDGRISASDLLADPNWKNGTDDDNNGFTDDLIGWNFASNNNDPKDDNGHGTNVAGIIAQIGNNNKTGTGVLWKARLIVIKVIDSSGSGSTSNVIKAANYAAAKFATAANFSLGSSTSSTTLQSALANAGKESGSYKGMFTSASAGNNGNNTPNYPAAYDIDTLIGVANSDKSSLLYSTSNYGSWVKIAAPGKSILALGTTYTGTSQAAPFVAGTAGLLRQAYPNWTATEIATRIVDTVRTTSSMTGKVSSGGILDAESAIKDSTSNIPGAIITVSATAVSSSQINLSWSTSSNATSYEVERKTASSAWSNVTTTTSTAFSSTGLSASTLYFFRVRGVNASGSGTWNDSASAQTFDVVSAPSAPASITATATSPTQISVSWSSSSGATSYSLQRSTSSGSGFGTIYTGSATSYADSGLSPSTKYFYRVSASNAGGTSSYSSEANATTPSGKPATPTGLTATAFSSSQINLSWNSASGATSYDIERSLSSASGFTVVGNTASTSFSSTGLAEDTVYYFRVIAKNSYGDSSASSSANAKTSLNPPSTPTGVKVSVISSTQLTVDWTSVAKATAYLLERSTSSGSGFSLIATVTTGVSYADSGLTADTTYYYRLKASNSAGSSAYSTVVSGKTQSSGSGTAPTWLSAEEVAKENALRVGFPQTVIFKDHVQMATWVECLSASECQIKTNKSNGLGVWGTSTVLTDKPIQLVAPKLIRLDQDRAALFWMQTEGDSCHGKGLLYAAGWSAIQDLTNLPGSCDHTAAVTDGAGQSSVAFASFESGKKISHLTMLRLEEGASKSFNKQIRGSWDLENASLADTAIALSGSYETLLTLQEKDGGQSLIAYMSNGTKSSQATIANIASDKKITALSMLTLSTGDFFAAWIAQSDAQASLDGSIHTADFGGAWSAPVSLHTIEKNLAVSLRTLPLISGSVLFALASTVSGAGKSELPSSFSMNALDIHPKTLVKKSLLSLTRAQKMPMPSLQMAMDGDHRVHVFWKELKDSSAEIYGATLESGDASFNTPQLLFSGGAVSAFTVNNNAQVEAGILWINKISTSPSYEIGNRVFSLPR